MKYSSILKKVIAILLCLTLLAGCAGCSKSDGEESSSSTPERTTENTDEQDDDPFSEDSRIYEPDFNFVTYENVDPNTKIKVSAPSNYSSEDVLNGITFKNVSVPAYTSGEDVLDADILLADGSNGTYELSEEGGFKEGNIYQIILDDEKLSYEGYDEEIRIYNLTTSREDTFNGALSPDVKFLDSSLLSQDDQNEIKLFDGLFGYDRAEGTLSDNNKGTGSFDADAGLYITGDIVAVYEDLIPTERDLEDSDKGVSYVEINDVEDHGNGSCTYNYQSADQKDVLFIPDVIPVQDSASYSNGQGEITISFDDLPFLSDRIQSNDAQLIEIYSEMGLDANTHVDVGDFLAFYTGDISTGEVTSYAKITEVEYSEENNESSINIKYVETTLDEMMSSNDIYRRTTPTEEQIIAAYDEDEVKADIISDLDNAGMLSASTYELAEAVIDTDEVQEVFGDTDITELNFYFGEDESTYLSGADFVEIANGNDELLTAKTHVDGDADVKVSPNIVHFAGKTGYGTGIRVEAFAKYLITIKPDNKDAKTMLKINMVYFFETEIMFDFTLDAKTIWKRKAIFPYIYDFSISGSYGDAFYVGVGMTTTATLVKNEKDDKDDKDDDDDTDEDVIKLAGLEWPEEVEKSKGSEKIMKLAEYVKSAGEVHNKIFPDQDTGGGALAQKYASFAFAANNNDWVDLIAAKIFDYNGAVDPWHIIAFRIKADFIVSAEVHVALGAALNYENENIDSFNILLFHEDKSSEYIEKNDDSTFRLDTYLFGVIGIKAGLRMKLMVGLFDARLDSLGFEFEGGLYARLWGYLYGGYEVKNIGTKDSDEHAYFSGGFLADSGAYYSITFVAELANGQLDYRKLVDSREYPFIKLGTENVTTDFAYEAGDPTRNFSVSFGSQNLTAVLPNEVMLMKAMDMKSGVVSNVSKANASLLNNYKVSFSSDAFSYKCENNQHLIEIDRSKIDDNIIEGSFIMTLKWKGSWFEFDTDELQRDITVNWVYDQTTIKFLNKDGSIFHIIRKVDGAKISEEDYPPADPVASGYIFKGWALEGETTPAVLPTVMPTKETVYEGIWEKKPVDIRIEYLYPYNTSSPKIDYYVMDTDVISGIFYSGDKVTDIVEELSPKNLLKTDRDYDLNGCTPYPEYYLINYSDSNISCDSIADDGSTVFQIAIERATYPITFEVGDGEVITKDVGALSTIEFPEVSKSGHYLRGWKDSEGNIVRAYDRIQATGAATYIAIFDESPTTVTVIAQERTKRSIITYMFVTFKTETFELDTDHITVSELIDMMGLSDRTFDTANSAYDLDSVIALSPNEDNRVTLRFK